MRNKNLSTIFSTLLIIGAGSAALALSMSFIFSAAQDNLSGSGELATNVGEMPVFFTGSSDSNSNSSNHSDGSNDNSLVQELGLPDDAGIILYSDAYVEQEIDGKSVSFVYQGQNVTIKDGLITRDEALKNATRIMDYIYEYVDKSIFEQYGIDKEKYAYKLSRRYERQGTEQYSVFLMEDGQIKCTIGISLNDDVKLYSFARDGLIDLCEGIKKIPDEYQIENWCMTTDQRAAIYDEYWDKSKHIVENVLGLPAIMDGYKNVDYSTYFDANNDKGTVTLGYVLEDGTYIRLFYNRVNQLWDGFVIAGYVAR